uniref:Putative secreted protein n=1 Tax=Anopheles triannulatus TaxID=58253 RepID=A0A2M4B4G8_9DIPT
MLLMGCQQRWWRLWLLLLLLLRRCLLVTREAADRETEGDGSASSSAIPGRCCRLREALLLLRHCGRSCWWSRWWRGR